MMSRFVAEETGIEGLLILRRSVFEDQRGTFGRLFCAEDLAPFGWSKPVAQANFSTTIGKGTVRGLHYQEAPHTEAKLVTCMRGSIFDVAVDIRKGSPTFLQWRSCVLSEENRKSFLIPAGFAHGFQAIEQRCDIVYMVSTPFCGPFEKSLNPEDPTVSITWPLKPVNLSEKDAKREFIDNQFRGITMN
jgi:dTDP-4-dehydrorhamnose 3,5-epimerase